MTTTTSAGVPDCPIDIMSFDGKFARIGERSPSQDLTNGRDWNRNHDIKLSSNKISSKESIAHHGRRWVAHGWISIKRRRQEGVDASAKGPFEDWTRRFAALRAANGVGLVYLFEKTGATRRGCFECTQLIDLENLDRLRPAEDQVGSLVIGDVRGSTWTIRVEYSHEEDHHHRSAQWLDVLSRYCSVKHDVVRVLRGGWLSKRGLINTGFRRRWMTLDSAHMLRYYKDGTGLLRGQICMRTVREIEWEEDSEYFNILTSDRDWQLCASSVAEAADWIAALRTAKDVIRVEVEAAAARQP